MDAVDCPSHGRAARTFVCQHVAEGLGARRRVGFFWTAADPDDPHPDAWCADCEARRQKAGGEWSGRAAEQLKPKILCAHCYEAARTFHMGGDPWS